MSPELSEDLLSAYLDDELDADTRAAVEAQVAASPAWRGILDDTRAARDALRALPRLDLPADGWAAVRAAVAADEPAPDRPAAPVRRLRTRVTSRPARWVGAAALAAAAVVAVAVLPTRHQVAPKVAALSTDQSARASVGNDPISALAGIGVMHGFGR